MIMGNIRLASFSTNPVMSIFKGKTIQEITIGNGIQNHIIFTDGSVFTFSPDVSNKWGSNIIAHLGVKYNCPSCGSLMVACVQTTGRIMSHLTDGYSGSEMCHACGGFHKIPDKLAKKTFPEWAALHGNKCKGAKS